MPAAANRNIATTSVAATKVSPPAISGLTVQINTTDPKVATHGGMTFHTNMFSIVKTAFDVAVMRLVSVPGRRSVK